MDVSRDLVIDEPTPTILMQYFLLRERNVSMMIFGINLFAGSGQESQDSTLSPKASTLKIINHQPIMASFGLLLDNSDIP